MYSFYLRQADQLAGSFLRLLNIFKKKKESSQIN